MIAAIAALAISCNNRLEFSDDVSVGGNKLDLSVWCASPETRADQTKRGEDVYNENALTSIDYFIYPENSTLETAAVAHGRWTPDAGTTFTSSKIVDMGSYQAQYGTKGYVFMLANVPADFVSGNESVNALFALPVPVTTFGQTTENGKFRPQDSFVMISKERVSFTLSNSDIVKVSVPLSRRAAKISLDIKIAKWFTEYRYTGGDKTHGTYVQTWYPNLGNVQVYLLNYTDTGDMKGTPTSVSETTKFASYKRKAYIPSVTEDGGSIVVDVTDGVTHEVAASLVTGNPFYSYPSQWQSKDVYAPFLKVIVEWTSYIEDRLPTSTQPGDQKEMKQINKEFYYKITIPNELDLKSNNWYKIDLDLSVLGGEADDAIVSIPGNYSVVAWSDPDDAMGGDLNSGRYLTVGGNKKQVKEGSIVYETFEAYGDKVDIPIITSHPFEVENVSSTYPTFVGPDYDDGHLTYTSDDSASAEGYNFKITPSGDYTYLSLEHNRVKGVNSTGFDAKDVAPITYTFKIKHTDNDGYYRYIKVIQYPAIFAQLKPGGNVFVDGYFFFQDSAPFTGNLVREGTFTLNNKTPGYTGYGYRSKPSSGNQINERQDKNYSYSNATALATPYGSIRYDGGLPQKMTLVTVTAFDSNSSSYEVSIAYNNRYGTRDGQDHSGGNPRAPLPGYSPEKTETYDYIIADPRENASWTSLDNYLSSNNGTSPWNNVSSIKVGSRNNPNYIAPAFMISSRWGRPGGTFLDTLEGAEKRCATYQEAGFPAGRWRLPTEAEIYFIYTLQGLGLVDELFSGDSGNYGYWASSGRLFDRQTDETQGGAGRFHGKAMFVENNAPENTGASNSQMKRHGSVRCVYDYWYWGPQSQQTNQNKFYPSPTQTVVAGY